MAISRAAAIGAALWVALAAHGCASSRGGPAAPATAPAPAAGGAAGTAPGAQSARAADPAEEITPEELASIPEPVPGPGVAAPSAAVSEAMSRVGTSEPDPARTQPREGLPGAEGAPSGGSGWVWRVQVFASEDLKLADRKAKEAAERLQARPHIEFDAPYYKVRLGDFATEEEAQGLRERAIQAGYPGAFRTRCAPDTTRYGE